MKRMIALLCILPLLLAGCNWLDGSYQSITPHTENSPQIDTDNLSATNLDELKALLSQLVLSGTENGVISLDKYDRNQIAYDISAAIDYTLANDPIAAYAVNEILYELGTSAGKLAAAITIDYDHELTEIRKIITVPSSTLAKDAIANALNRCDSGIVLYINSYTETDFGAYVSEHADLFPDRVMEHPEVTVNIYPQTGTERVVEVNFTYQTSKDAMKNMQKIVEPIFSAAALYVSPSADQQQKFSQLYGFLMERFDYRIQSSITPAYSLLQLGIGDDKAFADVYAAMCRKVNLDCWTVSGVKDSQPWHWNILRIDETYYHLDLLQCKQDGQFRLLRDNQMSGYTWENTISPLDLTQ